MRRASCRFWAIALLFGAQALDAQAGSISESAPLSIPGKKSVELLSQSLTLNDPEAAALILATVQLVYTSVPNSKTVTISILRDGAQLEAFSAEIGTGPRAVSSIPVTLHAWDSPGSGSHVYSIVATSSDNGAEAKARRLTVTELP